MHRTLAVAAALMAIAAPAFSTSAFAAPATPAVPAFQQALALVQGFYKHERTPTGSDAMFARDLARAYRKDSANPDEIGAVDFDWRYGSQDEKITGLSFSQQETARSATITVSFRNFGKPGIVVYDMCHATRGWRVADVRSTRGDGIWDLRRMLKLPGKVDC